MLLFTLGGCKQWSLVTFTGCIEVRFEKLKLRREELYRIVPILGPQVRITSKYEIENIEIFCSGPEGPELEG